MYLLDGEVVTSASDITAAAACEFAFLRAVDARLGRSDVPVAADSLLARAAELGDAHEQRKLAAYVEQYGAAGVITVTRPGNGRAALSQAVAETRAALESDAAVIYQAAFFDGRFVGFADFLERMPDGRFQVQDTKLARSPKTVHLLQLAAYGLALGELGFEPFPTAEVLLGDGSSYEVELADVYPVYRERRAHLDALITARIDADAAIEWGTDGVAACGSCDVCAPEVTAHRDLLLVAGMRRTQRNRLRAAGIPTIDQLASARSLDPRAIGIAPGTLRRLRNQARLQIASEAGGMGGAHSIPAYEVIDPHALDAIPAPDSGDIFFDFEGDPLYTEHTTTGSSWGLDYLFGITEADGTYRAFWAHSLAEEKQAFTDFITYVADRRRVHPAMHIYHYAPYERTHLGSLAQRHSVCEDEVDELLRANVLVDLYGIVQRALLIGAPSYSIKKLEPLYMTEGRSGDVTDAGASMIEYANAVALRDAGRVMEWTARLAEIQDYNRYDCESTLALRDWLLRVATENGRNARLAPDAPLSADEGVVNDDVQRRQARGGETESALLEYARDISHPDADRVAAELAYAAIGYHRREEKSFWWGHFERLTMPEAELRDSRDVFAIDRVELIEDWHRSARQRLRRRRYRVYGQAAAGSRSLAASQAFALYDAPSVGMGGAGPRGSQTGSRGYSAVDIVDSDAERGMLEVVEKAPAGVDGHSGYPGVLAPAAPPDSHTVRDRLLDWAGELSQQLPDWPQSAAADILRRHNPHFVSGTTPTAVSGDDYVSAILDSVLRLDRSYLAVQGPPGTGKTYTAARVIRALVAEHHWAVGVVAQSHAVVANLLNGVIDAGLDASLVAKKVSNEADVRYTDSGNAALNTVITDAREAGTGCVIGGTVWTFSRNTSIEPDSLDLLVIDEAGQYTLANTVAASTAARAVLMLGDPQQLPQVSQGSHPAPVDESALGWISAGADVLPDRFGYFLAQTRRMSPALTSKDSALAYGGALTAHLSTALRRLEGISPGVHSVSVRHEGNATASAEEAATAVEIVTSLVGTPWHDPGSAPTARPLAIDDIIVVTPYSAQVYQIQDRGAAAGYPELRVGTVDRFQGQEAAIAIVSMAASSSEDVPRGMDFLLSQNRLNVSISRAQWAAFIIHSPQLVDYLPSDPDGVVRLGRFLRLLETPEPPSTAVL